MKRNKIIFLIICFNIFCFIACKQGSNNNMVRINGGIFTMGSSADDPERMDNEILHQVKVSSFSIGKYQVTQEEYEKIMGTNPSNFKGNKNLPVENITWFDAIEYCNKRSQLEGLIPVYIISDSTVIWNRDANGYRLPTEAEWEYACRAGTTTSFNTGNNIDKNQANYNDGKYYPYIDKAPGEYLGPTMPVGSFPANHWGLYDMHGNVFEWCWDWYDGYENEIQGEFLGEISGTYRVLRGGSWFNTAESARSAARSYANPSNGFNYFGFRVVCP